MTSADHGLAGDPPAQDFTALELWLLGYSLGVVLMQESRFARYGRMVQAMRELQDKVSEYKISRSDWELARGAQMDGDDDRPF